MPIALQSLIGLLLIPLLAWAVSEDRGALAPAARLRWVAGCLAVQAGLAVLFTHVPGSRILFQAMAAGVDTMQAAVDQGARVVFGHLAGAPAPYDARYPQNDFILAVRVLPMIIVLSAIIRLLYHWGVLQRVIGAVSRLLVAALGLGGPLAVSAAASPFLGLIEAPMLVRPYLAGMSRGALFAMVAVTMSTVAGTVLAIYAVLLSGVVPGSAGHLLAGSLMNVPAALMLARLVVPEGFAEGPAKVEVKLEDEPHSSMDAIAQGTLDGVMIAANVAAMLIVAVALVALLNAGFGWIGGLLGLELSLQRMLGAAFAPLAFAIGIPWSEASAAGSLLGVKISLNEFLAYIELSKMPADQLSDRSRLVMTYALCGFANFGSLGISVGGLASMAPERRAELVELAPKAMVVGGLATLMSAALIGLLTWP